MSKYKDDELTAIMRVSEKEPMRLDDRIIVKMAKELLEYREGIRVAATIQEDDARDYLKELLR